MKRERHFIDARDIKRGNNRILLNVTKEGDLSPHVGRDRAVGAAQQNVGCDTDLPKLADAVLCRFRLQLAGGGNERDECDVHEDRVAASFFITHLADRLHERQRFDVTDRASDLDDQNVRMMRVGHSTDRSLDLVRDVRDDLDRLAEVISTTLFVDHGKIYTAGGPVIRLRELGVREPLVVAEIEIGLGTVVRNEHLAVLERRHRPRIDVDIRVKLHHLNLHPSRLEQTSDRACGQSLAQARNYTACYEYVFGHNLFVDR